MALPEPQSEALYVLYNPKTKKFAAHADETDNPHQAIFWTGPGRGPNQWRAYRYKVNLQYQHPDCQKAAKDVADYRLYAVNLKLDFIEQVLEQ